MNWGLEIAPLFQAAGLKSSGEALMNENTYDFDPRSPKDSWLYPVFLGFKKLHGQGVNIESFASIGTGSGIDSVGAFEIFRPRAIYQTDIHPNVPGVADMNAKSLIGSGADIQTFLGDLCEPLIKRGLKADLVYGNIPNIPSEEPVWEKKISASRFMARDLKDCPKISQRWLLSLQYLFLKQAKEVLKPGGVVVDAIGARVPYEILEKLFLDLGYQVKELASVYRVQSEPEEVLEGYAKAEKDFAVEFDFYRHKQAKKAWEEGLENKEVATPKLKEALKPYRISATKALKDFQADGNAPGHICSILCGRL